MPMNESVAKLHSERKQAQRRRVGMVVGALQLLMLLSLSQTAWGSSFRHHLPTSTGTSNNDNMARDLQIIQGYRSFVPLGCNEQLGAVQCSSWSSVFGFDSVHTERVIIPCGQCVNMDHVQQDTLDLQDGLDIRGKLVFAEGYKLHLMAPAIVVQGILEVSAQEPVDGTPMIQFTLTGQGDNTFEPAGENAGACQGQLLCNVGKKSITVAGGSVNIRGLPENAPTWLNLHDVSGGTFERPTAVIVPNSVKGKWLAGAEILLTSHTRVWNEHQQRTIVQVNDAVQASGYVELVLDAPFLRPTTVQESPDFAIEVALLSRNVVFDGHDYGNELQGGHFWVMRTPLVTQLIEGVDIRYFGQQGTLGRYPIHFHFCGDVPTSVVSKNTIRHSAQRCVVTHGTNKLRIRENVAYDTFGHCYLTEDGIETENEFYRNLGAQTKAVPSGGVIPDIGSNGQETDHEPATFWITNPTNIFVENVAAGSQDTGFWFEPKKRGPNADLFPNPMFEPLLLFRDNVIHSSGSTAPKGKWGALRFYNPGYRPRETATFEGLKAYRNDNTGAVLHRVANMIFTNCLFADNNVGIDFDRATDLQVRDVVIIGESESYRALRMRQAGVGDVQRRGRVVGIDLHTWKVMNYGAFTIRNVEFSGFRDNSAANSFIIHMDYKNLETGQFEMYTAFENVTIHDSSAITFCALEGKDGVDTAYVMDLDGDLSPPTITTSVPSTLLSRGEHVMRFVNTTKCIEVDEGCYNYCQDTCFRSVRFETDRDLMEGCSLKVCKRGEPHECSLFTEGFRERGRDPRTFIAHLPVGTFYDAVFLDENGQEVKPSEGVYKLEESFCSPDSAFGVFFAAGPALPQVPTTEPSFSPSLSPSQAPTEMPSQAPTEMPTEITSQAPTEMPTEMPSQTPTDMPSEMPSWTPTAPPVAPSFAPSNEPTRSPSLSPSINPTNDPTRNPTNLPTSAPTTSPSVFPSKNPTQNPTPSPTAAPSSPFPTVAPTQKQDLTRILTKMPTRTPLAPPTLSPTIAPGKKSSLRPTDTSFDVDTGADGGGGGFLVKFSWYRALKRFLGLF